MLGCEQPSTIVGTHALPSATHILRFEDARKKTKEVPDALRFSRSLGFFARVISSILLKAFKKAEQIVATAFF